MTKLTTERLDKLQDNLLQFQDAYSDPADKENYDIFVDALHMLDEFKAAKEKILAYEQAAEKPYGYLEPCDFPRTTATVYPEKDKYAFMPLYAAPVLPKQPELIGMKVSIDTGSDNIGHRLFGEIVGTSDSNGVPVLCIEVAENNGDMAARAQPVIPRELHSFVTDADIAALHRFTECCDDPESGGHDLEKEQVQRLEKIGALQRSGRISYITDFGDYLISATAPVNAQQNEPQNILENIPEQPVSELRARAISLYKPPFKFDFGYIWDADGQMVADQNLNEDGQILCVRGWGRISYLENPEALQDEVGEVIALALSNYWNLHIAADLIQPVSEPYKLPSGYALVPAEPTAAMFHAFNDDDYGRKSMRERYIQMTEAAPAQESE